MEIYIEYYATLRDERGCREEKITIEPKTVSELYQELQQQYNFSLATTELKVAINDEFENWDTPLKENDKIVFIPPVAGG